MGFEVIKIKRCESGVGIGGSGGGWEGVGVLVEYIIYMYVNDIYVN